MATVLTFDGDAAVPRLQRPAEGQLASRAGPPSPLPIVSRIRSAVSWQDARAAGTVFPKHSGPASRP